jgi:hypothetical protein
MSEMEPVSPTASSTSPPDPAPDQCDSNIAVILHTVGILLTYGRHLIDTIRQRATAPNFNAIAACFGTENLATILAHLNRGILRAAALERVLVARAASGNDIDYVERRTRTPETPAASAAIQPEQLAVEPLPTRKHARHPSRPAGWDDPELFMPTLEDLEREARRSPVGRTMLKICLDLAVVPGLCHTAFWNELFDVIIYFSSNRLGSIDRLMRVKARRRAAFANEQDRKRDSNWDWVNMSGDALRQVLGFFIGEPPVNPLDPAAAIATGPP